VPADANTIASGLNINLQTSITIIVDAIHHSLFGVLYAAITAAVTRKQRLPCVSLAERANQAQKK
jgi:hypothetical protein